MDRPNGNKRIPYGRFMMCSLEDEPFPEVGAKKAGKLGTRLLHKKTI